MDQQQTTQQQVDSVAVNAIKALYTTAGGFQLALEQMRDVILDTDGPDAVLGLEIMALETACHAMDTVLLACSNWVYHGNIPDEYEPF